MEDIIKKYCNEALPHVIDFRRDFHKYPEIACTEYRTASIIVKALQQLGYEVSYGPAVMSMKSVENILPEEKVSVAECERAINEGADPMVVEGMKYCYTGVVGVLHCGKGPTVGLRTDMDALKVKEKSMPLKEDFQSVREDISHACGHDAHTAIGLGTAEVLKRMSKDNMIRGTVKLIFQPAEEATIGGLAMCDAGIADDLDYLLAIHIGVGTKKTGQIGATAVGFPCLAHYEVHYTGRTSHSGVAPENGKNALLAACTATKGIYEISRSSKGWSRVNVGKLNSGLLINAVPGNAEMSVELRAENQIVFDQINSSAMCRLKGAADMHGCQVDIKNFGVTVDASCDPEMIDILRVATEGIPEVTEFLTEVNMSGAGEDATRFMLATQANGGKATYMMIGSDYSTAPHTSEFDVDEKAIGIGLETVARAFAEMMK